MQIRRPLSPARSDTPRLHFPNKNSCTFHQIKFRFNGTDSCSRNLYSHPSMGHWRRQLHWIPDENKPPRSRHGYRQQTQRLHDLRALVDHNDMVTLSGRTALAPIRPFLDLASTHMPQAPAYRGLHASAPEGTTTAVPSCDGSRQQGCRGRRTRDSGDPGLPQAGRIDATDGRVIRCRRRGLNATGGVFESMTLLLLHPNLLTTCDKQCCTFFLVARLSRE